MKALILAGGFGTRLGKIGELTPKGLITDGKTCLFDRIVHELSTLNDVKDIVTITNNRFYHKYQTHLVRFPNIKLLNNHVNDPISRRGALGDLLFAIEELRWSGEDVFVLVSDTYFEFQFKDEVVLFKKHNSFTTVVRKFTNLSQIENRLGCAVMEGERVVDFVEKPKKAPSPFAAIPFYIYPRHIVSLIHEYQKEGGNMDTPGSIIPYLLKKSIPVYALETNKKTIDVGTVTDMEEYQIISGRNT